MGYVFILFIKYLIAVFSVTRLKVIPTVLCNFISNLRLETAPVV
jgi:hypothetical protein